MNEYRALMLWWEATVRSLFTGDRERNEAGYTAEQVLMTAILAGGAIVIAGIIVTKFTSSANSIPTGP